MLDQACVRFQEKVGQNTAAGLDPIASEDCSNAEDPIDYIVNRAEGGKVDQRHGWGTALAPTCAGVSLEATLNKCDVAALKQ